ncbi:hypothetical protein [Maliponia aquimaris]|uniref:Uncharacterized protein n=1 Tax=Maliponia aquimaris TaxID=1673631 RepID=A0A238K145_9RHOB|nr:hypothetical protein [Maliponia aquimaris]SMX36641.1 hypothetical protein MAA8898_00942 [Maliponia aquimaris]
MAMTGQEMRTRVAVAGDVMAMPKPPISMLQYRELAAFSAVFVGLGLVGGALDALVRAVF